MGIMITKLTQYDVITMRLIKREFIVVAKRLKAYKIKGKS